MFIQNIKFSGLDSKAIQRAIKWLQLTNFYSNEYFSYYLDSTTDVIALATKVGEKTGESATEVILSWEENYSNYEASQGLKQLEEIYH